ncbi:hypothetical protein J3R30DRAFT_3709681 [Lentinula aciculospora]|uniref:Protein kinase domain-containing protein n=1 Tax=Lentinula aciculospora TaxID=153920 RepID=A0A9W9A2K4_9AGAR|nr:hypothetical protein J3R30DRAFT_3709681 [Lentinula aciculospora]
MEAQREDLATIFTDLAKPLQNPLNELTSLTNVIDDTVTGGAVVVERKRKREGDSTVESSIGNDMHENQSSERARKGNVDQTRARPRHGGKQPSRRPTSSASTKPEAGRFITFDDAKADLEDPREIAQVFYDILQIHEWLFDNAGILHRHISMGNIMFRRIDGNVHGVLNDFDLACRVNPNWNLEDGPSPNRCVGTKPFMAHDLLSVHEKRHMPRHDMESLFYVMLILVCCFERPGLAVPEPMPYSDWFEGINSDVHNRKLDFILFPTKIPVQPYFRSFRIWVEEIRKWLYCGYTEGRRYDGLDDCNIGVHEEDDSGDEDLEDDEGSDEDYAPSFNWYTLNSEIFYERMKNLMCIFQAQHLETRS